MAERVIFFILGLGCLGIALVMGFSAHYNYVELDRTRDFAAWKVSPGLLHRVTLTPSLHRSVWQWKAECEYSYEQGGRWQRAATCDLTDPKFPDLPEAQHWVETVLKLKGLVSWQRDAQPGGDTWALRPVNLPVKVRHSTRHPDAATLGDKAPLPAFLSWFVIAVLALLALGFAAAAVVLPYAAVMPPKVETPLERALGDKVFSLVSFTERNAYGALLRDAIAAAEACRTPEPDTALDDLLITLQAELKASGSFAMHRRRHGLHLASSLAKPEASSARAALHAALQKVDEHLLHYIVWKDPNRRNVA